jgi:AcrR family transcriptional regulator
MRRTPIQQRSRDTVDRVLAAADELVVRHGVEQVTVADISRLSGVAAGSIYQFFPTKTAVLDALAERYLSAFDATLQPLLEHLRPDAAEQTLEQVLDAYIGHFRDHPGFRALWQGRAHLDRLVELDGDRDALLVQGISGMLRQVGLTRRQAAAAARVVVSVAGNLLELAFADNPRGDPQILAQARLLLRGYLVSLVASPG